MIVQFSWSACPLGACVTSVSMYMNWKELELKGFSLWVKLGILVTGCML